MNGRNPLARLGARPDDTVAWDAWMKKQPDTSEATLARLAQRGVDVDDPEAIAGALAALFGAHQWPDVALAALRRHGIGALPVVDRMLDLVLEKRFERMVGPSVRLLAAIHAEPAADRLLARLRLPAVRDAVEAQVSRWPLYLLRRMLAQKPARNQPAGELLARLLYQNPDWLAALQSDSQPGEAEVLERLLAPREQVEDAALAALPPVLRQPPWRDRAALPRIPELRLLAIDRGPRLHGRLASEPTPPNPGGHYHLEGHATQVEMVFARHSRGAPEGAQRWDLARKALWALGMEAAAIEEALRRQQVEPAMFGPARFDAYEPWLFLWHLPPGLARSMLAHLPVGHLGHAMGWRTEEIFTPLLQWLGPEILPSLRRYVPRVVAQHLRFHQHIEWSALVPEMAQIFCRNRWRRAEAARWLWAYPETAARALLPVALGPPESGREVARQTLRALADGGNREALEAVAAEYGAEAGAALATLLAIPPEQMLPDKLPAIPRKLFVPGLPRLILRADGSAVPLAQVPDVLMCLALCSAEQPYPGLATLEALLTPDSLARFGRALLAYWQDQDAPSAERWMFQVQGHIGDDETARVLAAAIRRWRAELARVRAYDGLEMLGRIGSDAALMHLHSLAAQTRHADLSTRAKALIEGIAETRGLSLEELADRTVPDLGLDPAGRLTLCFGPRQFTVHFDEFLTPHVRDARGQRLKDLPKPNSGDDASLAPAAAQQYKDLKKQARSLSTLQLKRLERAMCAERRWSVADFRVLLLGHPLLNHLARRLLWSAHDGDAPALVFRIAEDQSLADRSDRAVTLPAMAKVGIVHPIAVEAEELADFARIFDEYEIAQPFPQIARETYRLEAERRQHDRLDEWVGRQVTVGSLLGLEQRGWNRAVGDGGMIDELVKPLGEYAMHLSIVGDRGWFVGSPAEPGMVQEIREVRLARATPGEGQPALGDLSAIACSEVQRDLNLLAWFTG